jgi:hypothetical protein
MRFPWKASHLELRPRIWFGLACLLAVFLCAEISFAASFEETTFEGRRITDIRIVDEHGANVTGNRSR